MEIVIGLGVAREDDLASVGKRQMSVEYLDGGELLEDSTCGEPRSQFTQALALGDLKTVGNKGDENVSLDAMLKLVIDGPYGEISLEGAKSFFDLSELHVEFPELRRRILAEIAAKQKTVLATACFPQFFAIERIGEGLLFDRFSRGGQLEIGNSACLGSKPSCSSLRSTA